MDWVKIITPPDEVKDAGIPVVMLSATHSYVPKNAIKKIEEITGRKPREGLYSYGKFEGVKIDETLPVMVFIHLGKEIVDLFGLKRIYFKKGSDTAVKNVDLLDARNLFVFINALPDGSENTTSEAPKALKFDGLSIEIPQPVRETFKTVRTNFNAHMICDDDGTVVAYSRDNKIWIPFDVGAMENNGRSLNWLPTSVTRAILRRAVPLALSESPPKPTEEDRIASLKVSEKRWIDVWKTDSTQRIKNIKSSLSSNENQYKDLCDQISSCVKLREQYSQQLNFEETCGNKNEPALDEFKRILENIPELIAIEFVGAQITFRTSMIYLEEDVSRDPYVFEPFPLGEFDIICQAGSTPILKNRTRTLKYEGATWHHPHAKEGHICYGNISSNLGQLSAMRKWHDVVTLAVQFLKNCTAKDDQWGKLGFKKWQEAGKLESEDVKNKEAIAPKVAEWAKFVPTVRMYNIKPGDQVLATCPNTCTLLDKLDDKGKPLCPISSDGKREGVVSDMLDEFVNVKWKQKLPDSDEETEVDCVGFTYDDILRLDGEPMYDGHVPPALYPEQEVQQEIADGLAGIADAVSKATIKKLSVIAQEDSEEMSDQDQEDGITIEGIDRMRAGVEDIFG